VDYENDLHVCNQPLSESGVANGPDYVVIKQECRACDALEKHIKKHYKDGVPRHVILSVVTVAQAKAIADAQRGSKSS
jgi:hypothetical protein